MTWPRWLGERYAIEQASRRWRGGRRDDSPHRCRLDDEITRVALNYVFMVPKPVTEREKKIPAGPLLLFDMCGLDTFIMTIGLTYMPIQPVASFLCFWYFWYALCGNQMSGACHRRDVVSVAASVRWRGDSTPSTRRRPRGRVGSMAWRLTIT